MFCSECGYKLDEQAKFCPNCGTKLSTSKLEVVKNNIDCKFNFKYLIIGILSLIIVVLTVLIIFVPFGGAEEGFVLVEDGKPHTRTVMIYLEGSNLESDGGIATGDLNSIKPELVDLEHTKLYIYTGGTKKWYNFISNEENAIYELTSSGFNKIKTYDKSSMGDPENLTTFINYVYDISKTDRYDLIFYDHGGAIDGAMYDDFVDDNLTVDEFKKALKNTNFNSNNKLETVLFRTCLNGTIEVANAFKDYASYMVASEEITLGSPKTPVLKFINDIEATDTAIEYGQKFIEAYKDQMDVLSMMGESKMQTYSIVDLSKLNDLNNAFDSYIKTVNLVNNYPDIVRVRSDLFQYAGTVFGQYDYNTVDMYSLINALQPYGGDQTKVLNAFNEAIVYNWTNGGENHGLSIYFPYTGKSQIRSTLLEAYQTFDFSPSYKKFISDFNVTRTSAKTTSFSKNNVQDNTTEIKTDGEFTLDLTDEQKKDYAESLYIIFKKESDGKFTIVYSSNNTAISGNTLVTKTENNLVRVKDPDVGYFYVPIVERTKDGKTTRSFGGLLENFTDGIVMNSATWYIDYDNNSNPYIVDAIISSGSDKGASGVIANLDDYTTYAVLTTHYNILDASGNYTDNWDNEGMVQGYEVKKNDFKMEKASMNGKDEFYCVFKIFDIYDNSYYSKLIKMN